jgi:hypothetical protein
MDACNDDVPARLPDRRAVACRLPSVPARARRGVAPLRVVPAGFPAPRASSGIVSSGPRARRNGFAGSHWVFQSDAGRWRHRDHFSGNAFHA